MISYTNAAAMLIVFLLGSTVRCTGQDRAGRLVERMEELDRFRLFTNCAPLPLVVFVDGREEEEAELEELEERLRTMAESRLRAARLYGGPAVIGSTSSRSLRVFVNIAGPAFKFSVTLRKRLRDEVAAVHGEAPTWAREALGTHGDDMDHIARGVSESLDAFILQYLRVNEGRC